MPSTSSAKEKSRAARIFLVGGKLLFGAVVLLIAAAIVLENSVTLTGEEKTPAGIVRNFSNYVTMRDGVPIAVDVWLPSELKKGEKIPTLIRATRYIRARSVTFAYRVSAALGQATLDVNLRPDIETLNEANFAVVRVDARGSGASGGVRAIPFSEDEIDDYREIIDWIVQQPWSNGRVGAYGVSYDSNTAELMARHGHPSFKASAPLYGYYDLYENLIRPGGVFNRSFLEGWSQAVRRMDTNSLLAGTGWQQWWARKLSDGIKPVDDDSHGARLATILSERNNPLVFESIDEAEFRDDEYGRTGASIDGRSPYHFAKQIADARVVMNPWVGWYDGATVDGALRRFAQQLNPQQLVIGPFTHGGKHDTNPYAEQTKPVDPSRLEQIEQLADFFTPLLHGDDASQAVTKEIRYYTLGENAWKTTNTWPPEGSTTKKLYFAQSAALSDDAPTSDEGQDRYTVDFTASTGSTARWRTINGPDVFYPDRSEEDKKLLTYTSMPLENDLEITGHPVVVLHLASSESDGALFVYLEEVAPDGRVTYLTEGILRLIHRAQSDAPPTADSRNRRTFLREDAKPMTPGKAEEIAIPQIAISVLVKKGHRIRVAIAGHDRSVFERIPLDATPVLTVERNAKQASHIVLPVIPHVGADASSSAK